MQLSGHNSFKRKKDQRRQVRSNKRKGVGWQKTNASLLTIIFHLAFILQECLGDIQMEFLDKPLVQFMLMCISLVILIGWFLKARPSFKRELSETQKRELETLISRLDTDQRRNIEVALDAGRKIEAIKLFRAANNSGLRDAKHAVEYMIMNK